MEFNLIKIKELIFKSNLSKTEQENFLEILSQANDAELKDMVELFEENLQNIEIINSVYSAKKDAIARKDKKAWKNILLEEYKSLKAM